MTDFLAQLLENQARARALRVFVSHEDLPMSVPMVAKRSGMSEGLIQKEVQFLERLEIIRKAKSSHGEKKQGKMGDAWILNPDFPHMRALAVFVQETSPAEFKQVEQALKGSGRLSAIILSGVFMGDPTRPADMLIAADTLNERRLETAMKDLEYSFGREIRYAAFSTPEFQYRLTIQDRLIRDTLDYPHRVLYNRGGIL